MLDVGDVYRSQSVCHLINERGRWKEREIQANFPRSEAETILNTPLRRNGQADKIFWGLDPKRISFVKSAYHFASNIMDSFGPSSNSSLSNLCGKPLCKTNVVPKAKITVWNIIKDIIPSKSNVWKKINYL